MKESQKNQQAARRDSLRPDIEIINTNSRTANYDKRNKTRSKYWQETTNRMNERNCDRFVMDPNTLFRNEHTVMGIKPTSGNYSLKPQ